MTTSEFIHLNRLSDPRTLALQSRRYPDVDMVYALNQIQGWQTARRKLPSWAACDGIVYPPHLNMEQCSSEPAALYKAEVVRRWVAAVADAGPASTSMADLTGGFGVDFSFVSRCFGSAVYVERNSELCAIVRGNLPRLGLANASVECSEAEAWLASAEPHTMLFLDPARRDEHGAKTVFIGDCTPDVCALLPQLLSKSRFVMLKLSPMLDWHKAVGDLQGTVREVHVVSVGGECKELLLVLHSEEHVGADSDATVVSHSGSAVRVVCVDIQAKADAGGVYARSEFAYEWGGEQSAAESRSVAVPDSAPSPCYLYEPNASVMKAGCFGEIERAFGVSAVSPNSHLFLSRDRVEGFPGRAFVIGGITTMNRRQLRQTIGTLSQANVAVRNFPLSAAELRKRLKLRDGGDVYIFATTAHDGTHVLYITRKLMADSGSAACAPTSEG